MINNLTIYLNYRQLAPIFIQFLYIIENMKNPYKRNPGITRTLIPISIIFLIIGLLGKIFHIPSEKIIGYRWTYFAWIEWALFTLLAYVMTLKITKHELFSLNYMVQASSAAGYLYELPYFINNGSYGLFVDRNINTQIFSTIIIIFILRELKIRLNTPILLALTLCFTNMIITTTNFNIFKITAVYQRIPTMLMLLSFITNMQPPIPTRAADFCEDHDTEVK